MSDKLGTDHAKARGWHAQTAAATMDGVDVIAGGLSDAEAAARLIRFGPNELPGYQRTGPLKRLFAQFHNLLSRCL